MGVAIQSCLNHRTHGTLPCHALRSFLVVQFPFTPSHVVASLPAKLDSQFVIMYTYIILASQEVLNMKPLDEHIAATPGIAGGKPRIAGHRITVQNIVVWHEWMGRSADEIATEYGLSLADVYAALAYYYSHQNEIDASIKESETFIEAQRQQCPSKLHSKLHGR